MKRFDSLRALARTDKWYVGGENRLLWAPPFPLHLTSPGFWDRAHYYNLELGPLFTWAILDEDGKELPTRQESGEWLPTCLEQTYRTPGRSKPVTIRERKCSLPGNVLASEISIRATSPGRRKLQLVAWTALRHVQEGDGASIDDICYHRGRFTFRLKLQSGGRPPYEVHCALGCSAEVESHAVRWSEGALPPPAWAFTPFAGSFEDRLTGPPDPGPAPGTGVLYMALHIPLVFGRKGDASVSVFFSAGDLAVEPVGAIRLVDREGAPSGLSESSWREFIGGIPSFACDDEYLTRYYWYRWYGLRLNTVRDFSANYRHPFVCEGIGYFRAPISYSAPCHVRENRWMHDPELAQGSVLTFLDHQRDDGGFRGYIDPHCYRQEMFYHADWGGAIRALCELHPDTGFLEEVYPGLARYASYFDAHRDKEGSGLFDITNHYETGQEYMSRYLAVDPAADRDNWGELFRLKGVDAAVYLYELKRTLALIARQIGRDNQEAGKWEREASSTADAIRVMMWDEHRGMFFDYDPIRKRNTGVKALTCFYPYMTDIVAEQHLPHLLRHLHDKGEFGTPFPFPSSSQDDPLFSAEGEWKGKRMNCPWNGRVWPMTNSHIAEALAQSAVRFRDGKMRTAAADAISRAVRMMFFDGDPRRPNAFEHYHPMNGSPSVFRGIDDYQHSWIVDLIMKYVVGFRPAGGSVVIDPFPFGLEWFRADEIVLRGERWKVERERRAFRVWRAGRQVGASRIGTPIVVSPR